MTNINSDVLTAVFDGSVLTAEPWRARLGAFCPRSTFPGTSVPGAGGTGLAVVVQSVPRVRAKAVLAVPAPQSAVAAQLGQIEYPQPHDQRLRRWRGRIGSTSI